MKKICFWPLFLLLVAGCGTSHKLAKSKAVRPAFNHEAMSHMINGAVEDLLGQPKNALVAYHQAAEIDTTSPGIYLAIAENYFVLEEINSAIRLARKALSLDPSNLDALELLAACYEKQRKLREALVTYQQILKIQPNDLETMYTVTTLMVINRQFDVALKNYSKMVQAGLDDPDYRLRIGNLLFQHRAIKEATTIYEDVHRTNPNFEPGYLAMAAVSKAQKDTVGMITWYQKALQQNPRFEDARAELVHLLDVSKRWDMAIEVYRSLIDRDSTNLTNKLQLGQYYYQKGDTTAARQWLETVIGQHPKSERGYLALGMIKHFQKDTLGEMALYTRILKDQPDFLDVRQRLRDIYVAEKKWDDALKLYEALQDNDSTYVGARVVIINILTQKGDTAKALEWCEALNKSHGSDWRVPFTLGRLYLLKSQPAKARPHFDTVIALRNDLPGLWVMRGLTFLQMDSVKLAEQNFDKARELFPDEPEINYYSGLVLTRQNKNSDAIPFYEKSLKTEPNSIQTMLALSAAYDEVRDHQKAEELYLRMLKLRPDLAIVLNNYAYHLATRNLRLLDALSMAEKALQAEPENGAYLDTVGWIHFQLGQYDKALEYIGKSLKIRTDSAEVMEHLGDVYEKMGQTQKARQLWQSALDRDASREELVQKIKRLAQ
jgi:tetratricopeptide (TPR) repeat protein